jgi:glycerophosphoryl diester phosphodiesterase
MSDSLIIAHRGASAAAAENTRTAFLRALVHGADGFETDVQLTADGIPVLWHDDDLGKLGRPERRIDDFTFKDLSRMDFGGWFAPAQAGEPVLSLAELLREFAGRTRLLLEIKMREDESNERRRLKLCRALELARPFREDGADAIQFSSFDLPSLIQAHALDPAWPCILNSEDLRSAAAARQAFARHDFLAGLCVPVEHLDAELAETVHQSGRRLAVYTCNTEAQIRHALDLKVDFLISDVPQTARQLRHSRGCSGSDTVESHCV